MWRNFQIAPHLPCIEIWNFSTWPIFSPPIYRWSRWQIWGLFGHRDPSVQTANCAMVSFACTLYSLNVQWCPIVYIAPLLLSDFQLAGFPAKHFQDKSAWDFPQKDEMVKKEICKKDGDAWRLRLDMMSRGPHLLHSAPCSMPEWNQNQLIYL